MKKEEIESKEKKEEIIVNGEKTAVGRLATYCAKQALLGNKVVVVNCEKAIITGPKAAILQTYRSKKERGGTAQKGPYFSRDAESIVRRAIRGMLPWKKARGKEVFRTIKCYSGMPKEYKDKKAINLGGEIKGPYLSIKEVSRLI